MTIPESETDYCIGLRALMVPSKPDLSNMGKSTAYKIGYRQGQIDALSAAMQLPEIKALVEALELAANRLHRCAVDYDTGTLRFYETCEWTDEACAAIAAIKEPKP